MDKYVLQHRRIPIKICDEIKKPVCECATKFSNAIGVAVRDCFTPWCCSIMDVPKECIDLAKHQLLVCFSHLFRIILYSWKCNNSLTILPFFIITLWLIYQRMQCTLSLKDKWENNSKSTEKICINITRNMVEVNKLVPTPLPN